MSRSRKRNGVIKDGNKVDRQIHWRRFRSLNKQRIKQGKEPLLSKEVTCQWDICDYKIRWEKGWWFKRWKRDFTPYYFKEKRRYFNK